MCRLVFNEWPIPMISFRIKGEPRRPIMDEFTTKQMFVIYLF